MSELVIVDVQQGTPEWHALRDSKVRTASRTPMLMGTSKFQSRADLYDILTSEEKRAEGFVQRIRDFGNRMEPRARAALELMLGVDLHPMVGYRGDYLASLDCNTVFGEGGRNFDIKVPYSGTASKTWQAALRGEIEPMYADQLEHQHRVWLPEETALYVYIDDSANMLLPYQPNDQRWGEIQRAWDEFMEHFVRAGVRPVEYAERNDDAWRVAASEFVAAKAALAAAEKREKEAKAALAAMAGGIKTAGFGVRVNVYSKAGSIDWEACARSLNPNVDGEPFRKEGSTETRVEVVKPKKEKA